MASDLYSVLGVGRAATDAQIRGAYRLRALATHPDKGGNEDEFLKARCIFSKSQSTDDNTAWLMLVS